MNSSRKFELVTRLNRLIINNPNLLIKDCVADWLNGKLNMVSLAESYGMNLASIIEMNSFIDNLHPNYVLFLFHFHMSYHVNQHIPSQTDMTLSDYQIYAT